MTMQQILIIGPDAYLARDIEKHFHDINITKKDRFSLEEPKEFYSKFDGIINFTIQPQFFQKELSEEELIDVQIAKKISSSKTTKLIMLSSRKVYGAHMNADILQENDILSPQDFYARNKLKAENLIRHFLPNQHLILRIANILGEPVNRLDYKTFMGWISKSIISQGKLIVTENPYTKKDFITKEYLQKALFALIFYNKIGTYNIGAQFALPLKELLTKIVGKENISFDNTTPPRDQFILDSSKLHEVLPPFSKKELNKKCSENRKKIQQMILMKGHING